MYSIALSTQIDAPVQRVWRALCDPAEVVQWDEGVIEALDAPLDYPQPGQHVRWRYRSRVFSILHDRPQAVVEHQTLHSLLDLGPLHMDETYTLAESPGGCRLDLRIDVSIEAPLIGALIESLYAGPTVRRGFQESLAALKRHCELT